MAIWEPSNIILTNIGKEILSKVQAGVGSIAVSRVVTGKTSSANLATLTAIPSIAQEALISSVHTDINGSALEIQVKNIGLATEYDLYQIGVYVTHVDYVGEKLYMVAQCTEPDHVPLPTVTPLVLNFSLYLAHSGTTNVSITTSNAGLVTMTTFTNLQGAVETHTNNSSIHNRIELLTGAIPVSNPDTLIFKVIS